MHDGYHLRDPVGVDLPHVFIDAEKHHRAYRCEKTYLCAVGSVTAMRTLYRARPGERAVAAMERNVGIVEGYWTPHAARQGAMLTAHLVPREAEEVLGVLGNMTPSKSSLGQGGATVIEMITVVVVKMDWPAHPTPGSAGGG